MHKEATAGQKLLTSLVGKGYRGRIVSARRVAELREGLESHHREGRFDEEFYQARLTVFKYDPPENLPEPQSLTVVAVPRPQTAAVFTLRGQTVSLIIPPTYTNYRKIAQKVVDLLAEVLEPAGYRVARALVPLKSLAARSGLAEYGRNNICYVRGMGSFFELVGVYSDLPCSEDSWQEARMMEACVRCRACMRHCPTNAITEERFLFHAERCLVYHSERPGSVPFPSWIDPSWHNCLVGCMLCQRFCPEDKNFVAWIEELEQFSDEETSLLLRGSSKDSLPEETLEKLIRLDLLDELELLPRNLGVFMKG